MRCRQWRPCRQLSPTAVLAAALLPAVKSHPHPPPPPPPAPTQQAAVDAVSTVRTVDAVSTVRTAEPSCSADCSTAACRRVTAAPPSPPPTPMQQAAFDVVSTVASVRTFPAGHALQPVDAIRSVLVTLPTSHCKHSLAPAVAYRPTGQSVHVSVCCVSPRNLPAGHAPQA